MCLMSGCVSLARTGDDTMLGDQSYRYLTVDEMKSLGDDSLPIDVTKDEKIDMSFISNTMAGEVAFFLTMLIFLVSGVYSCLQVF